MSTFELIQTCRKMLASFIGLICCVMIVLTRKDVHRSTWWAVLACISAILAQ